MRSMKRSRPTLNPVVRAILSALAFTIVLTPPGSAQTASDPFDGVRIERDVDVENLLAELAQPDQERWARIERQILRAWSRSGSSVIDYLFQRGQEALQTGQADAAIDHFSVVLDHDPDFAEAWNGRATAFFLANDLGPAMSDIEQVLLRNPNHFGALAGLGMILAQLDRPEEARTAFEASLRIHPHQEAVQAALSRLVLASEGRAL